MDKKERNKIFFSFAEKDKDIVNDLIEQIKKKISLSESGYFKYTENVGKNYLEDIDNSLKNETNLFVFFNSENYYKSLMCNYEYLRALELEKRKSSNIIQIKLDQSDDLFVPAKSDIYIAYYSNPNWLDLFDRLKKAKEKPLSFELKTPELNYVKHELSIQIQLNKLEDNNKNQIIKMTENKMIISLFTLDPLFDESIQFIKAYPENSNKNIDFEKKIIFSNTENEFNNEFSCFKNEIEISVKKDEWKNEPYMIKIIIKFNKSKDTRNVVKIDILHKFSKEVSVKEYSISHIWEKAIEYYYEREFNKTIFKKIKNHPSNNLNDKEIKSKIEEIANKGYSKEEAARFLLEELDKK